MGIFGSKQQDEPVAQDDQAQHYAQANIDGVLPAQANDGAQPIAVNDAAAHSAPAVPVDDSLTADYIMTDPPVSAAPPASNDAVWSEHQHDDTDLEQLASEPIGTHPEFFSQPEPEVSPAEPPTEETPAPILVAEPEPSSDSPSDSMEDLAAIKQEALKQLSPLVEHLDQSPEERFHTTMMMLQATDDQKLVKPAYEAAQSITDERARAQALLDIVNEINYFTQKS